MFTRGQRIIITKSSAKGKTHPQVGDIGYLSNMYLFYADRFILMDGYFYRYKQDIGKESSRCERKKFIIDLGMNTKFRNKLKTIGVPKNFFLKNPQVANLNNYGFHRIGPIQRIDYPDQSKTETVLGGKGGHGKIPINIPYGSIALFRDPLRKKKMTDFDLGGFLAWFNSISSVISIMTSVFISKEKSSIYNEANKQVVSLSNHGVLGRCGNNLDRYVILRQRKMLLNNLIISNITAELRKIQSLNKMLSERCDATIRNFLQAPPVKSIWQQYGYEHISTSNEYYPGDTGKLFMSIFFRSILMPGNINKKLEILSPYLPWDRSKRKILAKKFSNIRKEVDNGSEALARIWEENLLV